MAIDAADVTGIATVVDAGTEPTAANATVSNVAMWPTPDGATTATTVARPTNDAVLVAARFPVAQPMPRLIGRSSNRNEASASASEAAMNSSERSGAARCVRRGRPSTMIGQCHR